MAIVLASVGVALGSLYWALSSQAFADTVDGFHRFTPPGELAHSFERGAVHIYAEPDRFESSSSDRASLPRVEVFSPEGSPVPQIPYLRFPGMNDGWTYQVAGHRGIGITSFTVSQPGEYRIVATGGDGVVLALGEAIGMRRERFTFNALGYAFLGILAGGIAAAVVALMRRRSTA